MRGSLRFDWICFAINPYLYVVGVLDGCLLGVRCNLGLLHIEPVFWLRIPIVLSLEFGVLDVVLVSSDVSRAHLLAFLRFFMPFTKHCYCRCILGMRCDATGTKYLDFTINTDGASG